jgi:CBS domain-containing protein
MKIADICSHRVLSLPVGASVADAAALMQTQRVGTLIITRTVAGRPLVAGILTDRDVVSAQLEEVADFSQLAVERAMTAEPILVRDSDEVAPILQRLRLHNIRRAPVVDEAGVLIGLISTDDLLQHLARQIGGLAAAVTRQLRPPA